MLKNGSQPKSLQTDKGTEFKNRDFQGFLKSKKVQVGKDQEKAQSEKDSHSKNRGGKKPN